MRTRPSPPAAARTRPHSARLRGRRRHRDPAVADPAVAGNGFRDRTNRARAPRRPSATRPGARVTADLTIWTDGGRLWCTYGGQRRTWPAADTQTATTCLAALARPGAGP